MKLAKNPWLSSILTFSFLAAATFAWAWRQLPAEISIQSEESKTIEDGPVFNKIRYFSSAGKDIWMMNQSHHGLNAVAKDWDRLMIVVDTKTKLAHFYQLEPGPLEWKEGIIQRPFRVSCFLCHANGPRAIRPEPALQRSMSWQDKLRVGLWNLKIKSYGKLGSSNTGAVFRFPGQLDNDTLKVKTCLYCHNENGFFARGELRRQNAISIRFMVDKGYMPPLGLSLSQTEKNSINEFLLGF